MVAPPSKGSPFRPQVSGRAELTPTPWSCSLSSPGLPSPGSPPASKTQPPQSALPGFFILSLITCCSVPFTSPQVFSQGELIHCSPLSGSHPHLQMQPRTCSHPSLPAGAPQAPSSHPSPGARCVPQCVASWGRTAAPQFYYRSHSWLCPLPSTVTGRQFACPEEPIFLICHFSPFFSPCTPPFTDSSSGFFLTSPSLGFPCPSLFSVIPPPHAHRPDVSNSHI